MRFPYSFKRQKGSVSSDAAIGSDSAPTAHPTEKSDNQGAFRLWNTSGYPVERIAVLLDGASDLDCTLYVYEDRTGLWFAAAAKATLVKGRVNYITVPILAETSQRSKDLFEAGGSATPGCLEVAVVLADPGAASNGVYTVAFGPCVSG